jgi:hypothetical protein
MDSGTVVYSIYAITDYDSLSCRNLIRKIRQLPLVYAIVTDNNTTIDFLLTQQ